MDINIATRILAGVNEPLPPRLTQQTIDEALAAVSQARAYGRAWHWEQAETALRRAYRTLGVEYPETNSTGYAWHLGRHPIQLTEGHQHQFTTLPRYGSFPEVLRCECGVLAQVRGDGALVIPSPEVCWAYAQQTG